MNLVGHAKEDAGAVYMGAQSNYYFSSIIDMSLFGTHNRSHYSGILTSKVLI